jgi:hypothetical protein
MPINTSVEPLSGSTATIVGFGRTGARGSITGSSARVVSSY